MWSFKTSRCCYHICSFTCHFCQSRNYFFHILLALLHIFNRIIHIPWVIVQWMGHVSIYTFYFPLWMFWGFSLCSTTNYWDIGEFLVYIHKRSGCICCVYVAYNETRQVAIVLSVFIIASYSTYCTGPTKTITTVGIKSFNSLRP